MSEIYIKRLIGYPTNIYIKFIHIIIIFVIHYIKQIKYVNTKPARFLFDKYI